MFSYCKGSVLLLLMMSLNRFLCCLIVIWMSCLVINSSAHRSSRCAADKVKEQLFQNYPERRVEWELWNRRTEDIENITRRQSDDHIYIIPVVFHIIYYNEAQYVSGNTILLLCEFQTKGHLPMSDQRVLENLAVLNQDYRRLNRDSSQ